MVCEQAMYNFFINYQRDSNWCGLILAEYGQIADMQTLRSRRNQFPLVYGGWHFSSLGGLKMIRNKINSTSDGMCNPIYGLPEEEQNQVIEDALEKGYIWWRDEYLKKRTLEDMDIPWIEWFAKKYPYMYHG